MDRAAAIARARSMQEAARHDKRRQSHYRQQVKQKMAELERFCIEHGIEFVLEKDSEVQRASRVQGAPATLRTEGPDLGSFPSLD